EASLGIAIGSRFPDFSDGPRPRFVTIVGSIIGALLGIVEMAIMSLPLVLSFVLRTFLGILLPLQFVLALSAAVEGLLTCTDYVDIESCADVAWIMGKKVRAESGRETSA